MSASSRHRLEVAERDQPREARARTAGRRPAARGRRRRAHDRGAAVVQQVALVDRLDQQLVLLAGPRGARPGGGAAPPGSPSARRPAASTHAAPASRPPSRAQQRAQALERAHRAAAGRAGSAANAAAAAASVRSICSGAVGQRGEPRLELRRRRVDAARQQLAAPARRRPPGRSAGRRRSRATGSSLKNTVSRPGRARHLHRVAAGGRRAGPSASARSSRPRRA